MTYYVRLVCTFCFVLILFHTAKAQNQTNSSNTSTNQINGGNRYFVDEAGLQLAQSASPLDEFIDPEQYSIGPYDILSVQGNGLVEFSYRGLTVNASGDIITPLAGTINLAGLTLAEAKTKITSVFENTVKDTEVRVSLDRPRRINLHIGGNIPNPGRFVIPSGTRYDALVNGFFVGGELVYPLIDLTLKNVSESSSQRPTLSGLNFEKIAAKNRVANDDISSLFQEVSDQYDLRLVKITKSDGSNHFVDLSGYFNSGNIRFAPYINDGDQVTFIENSNRRPKVSISGAVNHPFSGSYRSDDTFEKLLAIAGGFTPEADSSNIVLIRIEDGNPTKKMLPVSELSSIREGDQVLIPFKEQTSETGITSIEGQVAMPGTYSIIPGKTTLGDLLDFTGGLTEQALPNGAYLVRSSFDDRGVKSVSNINMSLLSRSSDQFIEGFDYLELEQSLNPNRMPLNLENSAILSSTFLQDGDQIYIPKDEQTISILGQVNQPGFYTFDEALSVQDYLNNANGLTIAAETNRIYVIKAGSRAWYKPAETNLQSGDIIFVDRTPFEDVSTGRNFAIQTQQLRNSRTQLIIAGIGTAVSLITAYVAVTR